MICIVEQDKEKAQPEEKSGPAAVTVASGPAKDLVTRTPVNTPVAAWPISCSSESSSEDEEFFDCQGIQIYRQNRLKSSVTSSIDSQKHL